MTVLALEPVLRKRRKDCALECPETDRAAGGRQHSRWVKAARPCVTIAKPFAMGRTEVTFDQWDRRSPPPRAARRNLGGDGARGDGRGGGQRVAWGRRGGIQPKGLSAKTGHRYRLPSGSRMGVRRPRAGTPPLIPGAIPPATTTPITAPTPAAAPRRTDWTIGRASHRWCSPPGSRIVPAAATPSAQQRHAAGNVWEWIADCWHRGINAPRRRHGLNDGLHRERRPGGADGAAAWIQHRHRKLRSAYRVWFAWDTRKTSTVQGGPGGCHPRA